MTVCPAGNDEDYKLRDPPKYRAFRNEFRRFVEGEMSEEKSTSFLSYSCKLVQKRHWEPLKIKSFFIQFDAEIP